MCVYACVLNRVWGRVAALVLPIGGLQYSIRRGDSQGV